MRRAWIVGVVSVLVVVLVALYVFNTNLTGVTVQGSGDRRTWTIQGGDTVKLAAEQVGPDDRYRCELDGGSSYGIKGTPPVGEVSWSGDFSVATISRGTVILTCDPDGAVP